MFKPEKNLKLSLNRHFLLFFSRLLSVRFVSQSFANDVPHGYASFKHICNVIIGYVGGMNKSMLDLYKKLESQERGEKREKMDSNWISCLSLLYFFLFLSSLSLSCQYSSLLTPEKHAQRRSFSCVCLLSEKQETILLYLRLYKKLYYSNFRTFLSRPNACNGQLYFQLLWDAYSEPCDALSLLFSQGVPCSSVPTSKLYMKNHRLTHIEHRWALQIALVTRRCIQRSAPLALCKKLTFTDHSHRTRASGNSLRPFRPSSRPGTLSFSNRAPFFGIICHQAFNKHPPLHLLSPTI